MGSFQPRRLLITGGAGFIGSNLTRAVLAGLGGAELEQVVVLDALTYAGHQVNLAGTEGDPRLHFVHGDICDRPLVEKLFADRAIDAVLHLAAESHVDRSITDPMAFVKTNVIGTVNLLNAARNLWQPGGYDGHVFYHVST
ncbi:MAG TPA: GDP-mannose 4,6-dehydratase, partial [Labilithrix sp.]|nr:GDP-mannose 4,6-dehydratase [Labilithrix sp.]